jgi:regulatory protein
MDVITCVLHQNGKVQITADSGREFLIPLSIFKQQPLSEGEVVDLDIYAQNLAARLHRHALDRAIKYLAARPRSRKEVETRLRQYGYPEDTVETVLFKLEKVGVLNDPSFAEQWAHARSERGRGKMTVARELYQKGISKETAEAVLEELNEEQQLAKARELAEKWAPRYHGEEKKAAIKKLSQALIRRGYSWEIVKAAVDFDGEEDE